MLSENIAIAHSTPYYCCISFLFNIGERIGIFRTTAILIGFIGVLIIVKPGTDLFKLETLYPLISCFYGCLFINEISNEY